MSIHPLAAVSPAARLAADVTIGPFAVVEDDVEIGPGCKIAAHAVIKTGTRMGANNEVCEQSVIGGHPQHLKKTDSLGLLRIGENNVFREFCTVHRALKPENATQIGDNNLFMACAHIAHDCRIGNQIVVANNVLFAGHVTVEDRAFISGAVGVHQFCRIGTLAMVGGHARVIQDIPPYTLVDGQTGDVCGLNLVGLRRGGYTTDQIAQLKAAYRVIYRRGHKWTDMLETLRRDFATGPAAIYHVFLSQGTRGIAQERRMPPNATLKLRADGEGPAIAAEATVPAAEPRSKVG
ncbi:MAG: acyl-ACP--UDP-N-acetylglucosamine O-acyltransferase [Pirellulales bacterium]|nr:acyl-ACP--UDP-N-acetylglucosamine O-acyltransferase [Pirellulales bacterium]